MNSKSLSRIAVAVSFILAAPLIASAQQQPTQDAPAQKTQAKPAPQTAAKAKPAKVWTDDDLSSLRSPADDYRIEQQQDAAAAAAQADAAKKEAADYKPPKGNVPPPSLSNPKTPDDADKMIAWENRDLAAQQQFLTELKQQLATAPVDQQDRLQKSINDRMQVINSIQHERDGLVFQKQQLEKKAADKDKKDSSSSQSQ